MNKSLASAFNLSTSSVPTFETEEDDNFVYIKAFSPNKSSNIRNSSNVNSLEEGIVSKSFSQEQSTYISYSVYMFDKSKYDKLSALKWLKKYFGIK